MLHDKVTTSPMYGRTGILRSYSITVIELTVVILYKGWIKRRVNTYHSAYKQVRILVVLVSVAAYVRSNLWSVTQICKNVKLKIYKTVILPVILYGCETWTLTLREVDYTGDDWKTLVEDREVWRAYVHAVLNLRVR